MEITTVKESELYNDNTDNQAEERRTQKEEKKTVMQHLEW